MNPVLLVHPVVRRWAKPCNLPLGLAYTAAALKATDVQYGVLDDNMLRLSDDQIREYLGKCKVTGLSLIGISAICHQYREVKRWVGLIREVLPEQPIIVGGPISVLGEKLAKWLNVDVWQGESEVGFPEAVLSGALNVAGVHSSPRSVDALDSLPFPDWDSFDMAAYAAAPVGWINKNKWGTGEAVGPVPKSMNLLGSRGCPFKCAFCAHDFMGKRYRMRSPRNILMEMAELKRGWGVSYFHLSDDNTMASLSWLYKFCDAFGQHPLLRGCTWGCAGRADCASFEVLTKMRDSGCRIVGMGIESGSQRVLDAMNKRITVSENAKAIWASKRVFGSANYSLIVGTPGETDADINATIEMCRQTEIRPETVFVATPLPGAPWYDYALSKGLIPNEEEYLLKLDENARVINCNISGRDNDWVLGAKYRIEEATKCFEGAI